MQIQVHTVHRVIKIVSLFIALYSTDIVAQTVSPIYIEKGDTTHRPNKIYHQISKAPQGFMSELREETGLCYSGAGLFRFIVKQNSDVQFIGFSGKLPQKLIALIKANIQATNSMWIPEKRNGATVDSYPFLYFVSCDINLGDCAKNIESISEQNSQSNSSDMIHDLGQILKFSGNKNDFLVAPQGYILPVTNISSIK